MKLSKKLTVNIKSSHHNSSSSSSCLLPDPVLTQKVSYSPPGSAEEENLQQHMRMRVGFSCTSEEEQQELVTHT
jgi:hypothetical protein